MDGHLNLNPGPGVGQRRAGVPRKPLGKKLAPLRRIAPWVSSRRLETNQRRLVLSPGFAVGYVSSAALKRPANALQRYPDVPAATPRSQSVG
jgi:hypothetical protein